MPRELKAYGCIWSCGTRITTKRKTMERHEQTCFANPDRRACRTCSHDCIEKGDPTVGVPDDFYCDVDARPENVKALANCIAWEPRR